jgi:hypothetical protein
LSENIAYYTEKLSKELPTREQEMIILHLSGLPEQIEYLKRQVELGTVYPQTAYEALHILNEAFSEYGGGRKVLPAIGFQDYEPLSFELRGSDAVNPYLKIVIAGPLPISRLSKR